MGNVSLANLEVSVTSLTNSASKTLVKLDTKNTFDQGIKDARAWIFLMDSEGNVVGNQPQWIIGGNSTQGEPLGSKNRQTFEVAIDTTSKPTTAKVTISKIILEDGTELDRAQIAISEGK
jgi:hypothetical protein